jgi:tripartite-type tricarboxylate transporter receptor subunit TctC
MGKCRNLCGLVLLVAVCLAQGVVAADYPTRPISLVVPFSAGGPADLSSRIMAEKVTEFLGQPIVIENKAGASGLIGATYVAKAKPDGYTLLTGGQSTQIVAHLVKPDLGYSKDDLIPICEFAKITMLISAKADGPWKTLPEFIKAAQKNPGKYSYATYGTLSMVHLAMEFLCKQAGIKLTHIPYEGGIKANTALMGGHVDIAITNGTGGLYEAGSLRILATAEKERLPWMKEVPTLAELGYPIQLDGQEAIYAPKGTPKGIVDKLYDAHKKAFNKYGKELDASFRKMEFSASFLTPEETLKKNQREREIYYSIAKAMGVLAKP